MSSSYEIWLTDDAGRRITLLNRASSFFSYSRTTNGYGTVQFGIPLKFYKSLVPDIFGLDWRLDIWRSPEKGFPLRRESSYLLRKFNIYERDDGVDMIEFLGRSPLDILRREGVHSQTVSDYEKTDYADDMMKDVVRHFFINDPALTGPVPWYYSSSGGFVSTGEFTCDDDASLGPTISMSFLGQNILDLLKDIKAVTFQMNVADPSTNKKIYFDVVEGSGLPGGFGYVFRTYADLRGQDRTSGLVFSKENGNLKRPVYYEDYLDQITAVEFVNTIYTGTRDSPDGELSRWNRINTVDLINSNNSDELVARYYKILNDNKADKSINCTFLNTPGGPTQPRSLYGVDWDLGDLLPVHFAGKVLNAEVKIVYVSVDENGSEEVTGRNEVGSQ